MHTGARDNLVAGLSAQTITSTGQRLYCHVERSHSTVSRDIRLLKERRTLLLTLERCTITKRDAIL